MNFCLHFSQTKQRVCSPHPSFAPRRASQTPPSPAEKAHYASRFTAFLRSANALYARRDLKYVPYFADSEKYANPKNAPWFRVNFALAKLGLGEAQDVSIHSRSDKALNR